MFCMFAAAEGLVRIRVTRADEHTPLPQPGSVFRARPVHSQQRSRTGIMRVGRHRQVMDGRARRISTRSVARLLRHGRRWCGRAYRLVFVALSLNVNVVTQDATHRYRAIDTLTAMTGIFVICAFALMEAKTTALWASNGSWSQPSRSPYTYTGTSRPSVAAEALPGFAEGVIVAVCSTSPKWSAQRCSSPTKSPGCMSPR